MDKKNIGVFFGSGSVEHDISIITASLVISGLKGLGHSVTPVYLTKKRKWMIGEELGDIKFFSDPKKIIDNHSDFSEYFLDMQESVGKMVFKKKGLMGKEVVIDLAFPAFHGTYGEDGTIQGLFEMFGLPYVGCGVAASAIAMDKVLTKIMMRDAGLPTTNFYYLFKYHWDKDRVGILRAIHKDFKYPLFVKPVHLGSSIGIGRATDEKSLERIIEVAFHYDQKVIVEEAVGNLMDITCCVIGNENPTPSLLQESVYSDDMFDFNDKYITDGGGQTGKATNRLVIPARVDEPTTKAIQDVALAVYKALECSGIARVDFLYNKETKQFFANEVNPLPGTLYHHLWKASRVELDELLKRLIQYAEEKHEQKRGVNYSFESSVLHSLGGNKGSKLKN